MGRYHFLLLILFFIEGCGLLAQKVIKSDKEAVKCRDYPRALQILGSGGPELDDGRRSSGYLIWIGGSARALVDIGSGVPEALGQLGVRVSDLQFIGISHFHVDHSAGLPILFKSLFFENKKANFTLVGPQKGVLTPSTSEFVAGFFNPQKGLYRYLSENVYQDGISIQNVPEDLNASVFSSKEFHVLSAGVDHGPIPSRAYRFVFADKSLVFSGDTRATDNTLERLAKGSDLLVLHNAIAEEAKGVAEKLHMKPSRIGELAHLAGVQKIVLSHFMKRSSSSAIQVKTLKKVRAQYEGEVVFARDLDCFPF